MVGDQTLKWSQCIKHFVTNVNNFTLLLLLILKIEVFIPNFYYLVAIGDLLLVDQLGVRYIPIVNP